MPQREPRQRDATRRRSVVLAVVDPQRSCRLRRQPRRAGHGLDSGTLEGPRKLDEGVILSWKLAGDEHDPDRIAGASTARLIGQHQADDLLDGEDTVEGEMSSAFEGGALRTARGRCGWCARAAAASAGNASQPPPRPAPLIAA